MPFVRLTSDLIVNTDALISARRTTSGKIRIELSQPAMVTVKLTVQPPQKIDPMDEIAAALGISTPPGPIGPTPTPTPTPGK